MSIMKRKSIFAKGGILATVVASLFASLHLIALDDNSIAYADDVSIQGMTTQASILSVEDAVLQNYNMEDLIATQSFILNRPYDGNGRVIDANEDGVINCFDMCILKHDYMQTGNYNVLLTEMINGIGATNITTNADGAKSTNRVAVRATQEYDFSEFCPIAVLSNDEYKYLLQFESYDDAINCVTALQSADNIVYAELDEIIDLPDDNMSDELESNSLTSNIQKASNSWGVSTIEADKFAKYLQSNFNSHITVAVVDTGVSNHSFLSGRLLNGGYDYVNGDNDPTDDQGHGTHVAGTVVDCTPGLNIDILPVKVMYPHWERKDGQWVLEGSGKNSLISAGIDYATDMGADVINLSLGGKGHSKQIDEAITRATKYGVTVVVSAGNNDEDTKYYCPAHISNAIVVSAIDSSLSRASFPNWGSNFGQSVDVAAPGVNIKSCLIGGIYDPDGNQYYYGDYALWSGTSMAAPHISAAAAMIKYANPSATPAQIESTLIGTCQDLGSTGYDVYYGHGVPKLSKLIKQSVNPAISLSQSSWSGYVGENFTLKASVVPSDQSVVWSSSDTSVATVSNGNVTAQGAGTATIIASFVYEGQTISASCSVTVKPVSIALIETKKTVYQTDKFQLNATTSPSGLGVSWTSSDSDVAIVSDGKVTARNPGSAVITATITYAGRMYTASCNVTVLKVSVEINPKNISILLGDTSMISCTTSPPNMSVSWESSNNVIASVAGGKITANAPGTVTITASITYNGKVYTDTATVKVEEPSVELNYHQTKLARNETLQMLYTVKPEGQNVTWSSEDTSICTIAANGLITAKSIGNTMITATITYAGNIYADQCNVIVGEPKVTLDKSTISMYVSDTQSLVASVIAVDGMNITSETKSDISWSTSNSSVATVDSNGAVKGIAKGTATITAKYVFCGITYSATCTVTVEGKPSISLNKSSLSMYIGDTSTLTATVIPTNSSVSWSSSNTSVAMVSSSGKITAVSNGTATITASFRYNGVIYSTTCTVTVTKPSISVSISSSSIWLGDTTYVSKSGNIPSGVTVSWSSSNTSVATVNSSGTVTGVGGGSATITGSFTYGGNKYSASTTVKITTSNSVRTFFIYPSSDSDKHIIASGYASSTVFTLNANLGFVANKVTIQVTSTDKQLQNNDTIYDYVAYSNEVNMTKVDASHWSIETKFRGFDSGTYFVRCRAYNGSSSATAYVRLIIL